MDEKEVQNLELQEVEETRLPDDVPLFEGDDLASLLEALLFASSEPLSVERLVEITRVPAAEIEGALAALTTKYAASISGMTLVQVAGQYQIRTDARFAPYIRVMRAGRPKKLSHAALETLAVVAYRQPVVKSDIEKIRGVDVTPTLKTLLDRRLIRIIGHQSTVGQPALYGTTEEFLKLFGLNSLGELPTLRDLKELERDPGEPTEEAVLSDAVTGGEDESPVVAEPGGIDGVAGAAAAGEPRADVTANTTATEG